MPVTELLDDLITCYGSLQQPLQDRPSVCDDWTDEEIHRAIEAAPPVPGTTFILAPGSGLEREVQTIHLLCPDTIIKVAGPRLLPPPEVRALEFVRANTSIPVPRVRRLLVIDYACYILMERIEGVQLGKVWDRLTMWQQFMVAWTIRLYIKQLRSASKLYPRRHVPGPMADVPVRVFESHWLYKFGPCETYADLADEFSWRHHAKERGVGPFDDSEPLVLTHGDINLHNIVLGRDGRLWLVDFGFSGFYPPWFEYTATLWVALHGRAPPSWCKLIPLMCGAWEKQRKWARVNLPKMK